MPCAASAGERDAAAAVDGRWRRERGSLGRGRPFGRLAVAWSAREERPSRGSKGEVSYFSVRNTADG